MEDDLSQRLIASSRQSFRAVLAPVGADVSDALRQAGIFNPVSVPVVEGEDPTVPGGILGNGVTPNLTAVLEPDASDWPESFEDWVQTQPGPPDAGTRPEQARGAATTNLPAAFGRQPLAPVRKQGA